MAWCDGVWVVGAVKVIYRVALYNDVVRVLKQRVRRRRWRANIIAEVQESDGYSFRAGNGR